MTVKNYFVNPFANYVNFHFYSLFSCNGLYIKVFDATLKEKNEENVKMKKVVLILVILLIPLSLYGLDDKESRETLRDLKAFYVDIFLSGIKEISETQIRTDTELKLRLAGINVVDNIDEPLDATLFVDIEGTEYESGDYYIFMIMIGVHQLVIIPRFSTDKNAIWGETWSITSYGIVKKENINSLKNYVRESVDIFLNAYLSVNPK